MVETSPQEVLLNHGRWIGASDFAKLIANKRNVSERQARIDIRKAYENKEIKKHVFWDRTVIYGLDEFGPPTNETSTANFTNSQVENVRKALEESRCELAFFREPSVKEVAYRVGKIPEVVKPILYALAPETGWKEPDNNAERDAKDAINIAGWLLLREKGEQNYELEALLNQKLNKASKDTLRRAQAIRRNCPNLIPKVALDDIVWPEETKMRWHQVFGTAPPVSRPSSGVGIAFPRRKNE